MKEQLYDGRLDGMEVEVVGPSVTLLYQGEPHTYYRRGDGRLYLKGSKWDLPPRKHDRL